MQDGFLGDGRRDNKKIERDVRKLGRTILRRLESKKSDNQETKKMKDFIKNKLINFPEKNEESNESGALEF